MENEIQAPNRIKTLFKLFMSMIYISTFTFGGGFVIVTFMKKKFVDELHWISEDEMLDLVALAQSSPGAITVNAAILVGWRMSGAAGMAAAVIGTVLPPIILLSAISLFYGAFASNIYVKLVLKGMQAGVAAVILDVACDLGAKVVKERSYINIAIMAAAFAAAFFMNVNVMYIIIAAILIGGLRGVRSWRKGGKQ